MMCRFTWLPKEQDGFGSRTPARNCLAWRSTRGLRPPHIIERLRVGSSLYGPYCTLSATTQNMYTHIYIIYIYINIHMCIYLYTHIICTYTFHGPEKTQSHSPSLSRRPSIHEGCKASMLPGRPRKPSLLMYNVKPREARVFARRALSRNTPQSSARSPKPNFPGSHGINGGDNQTTTAVNLQVLM